MRNTTFAASSKQGKGEGVASVRNTSSAASSKQSKLRFSETSQDSAATLNSQASSVSLFSFKSGISDASGTSGVCSSRHSSPERKRPGEQQQKGFELFAARLQVLQNTFTNEFDFDLEERLPNATENRYKNRDVMGTLLHYAIDKDSTEAGPGKMECENCRIVLEAGAKVDSWMCFQAYGKEGQVKPIHLAACRGLAGVIELLVEYRAEVNAKSMHNGKPHFCPIHDAAFHRESDAVECLLKLRADPNSQNRDGQSSLHIVAKNGADDIAELLVTAKATPDRITRGSYSDLAENSNTPLLIAVRARMFPNNRLHLLAPFSLHVGEIEFFDTIMEICKVNVPAAKGLVEGIHCVGDQTQLQSFHNAFTNWTDEDETPVEKLTEILKIAPEVAIAILNLFLITPKVTMEIYHPLPRVANLVRGSSWFSRRFSQSMLIDYRRDTEWTYDSESVQAVPAWHKTLVPAPEADEKDAEVEVKRLSLPNILDVRLVHALNSTTDVHVYESLPIQALLECCWECAQSAFVTELVFEVCVVSVLSAWSVLTLEALPMYGRHTAPEHVYDGDQAVVKFSRRSANYAGLAWASGSAQEDAPNDINLISSWFSLLAVDAGECILWAALFREAFVLSYQAVAHRGWGFSLWWYFSLQKVFEIFTTALLAAFMFLSVWHEHSTGPGTEELPHGDECKLGRTIQLCFCVSTLLRFFKLVYLLRLVRAGGVGYKIMPILCSIAPMGEFGLFALCIFASFFVPFLSSRGKLTVDELWVAFFFGSITADGDALADLRLMGNDALLSHWLVQSMVIVFTVLTLNLMIAILGNVYADTSAKARLLFLQDRSKACEQYLLEPAWPAVQAVEEETGVPADGVALSAVSSMETFAGDALADAAPQVNTTTNTSFFTRTFHQLRRRFDEKYVPDLLSLLCFALALVFLLSGRCERLAGLFCGAGQVLLKAARLMNDWVNRESLKAEQMERTYGTLRSPTGLHALRKYAEQCWPFSSTSAHGRRTERTTASSATMWSSDPGAGGEQASGWFQSWFCPTRRKPNTSREMTFLASIRTDSDMHRLQDIGPKVDDFYIWVCVKANFISSSTLLTDSDILRGVSDSVGRLTARLDYMDQKMQEMHHEIRIVERRTRRKGDQFASRGQGWAVSENSLARSRQRRDSVRTGASIFTPNATGSTQRRSKRVGIGDLDDWGSMECLAPEASAAARRGRSFFGMAAPGLFRSTARTLSPPPVRAQSTD